MDAIPLRYLLQVDPEEMKRQQHQQQQSQSQPQQQVTTRNDKKKVFMGPAHVIHDPSHFPSISTVINESKFQTGIYIPDQYCQDVEECWHEAIRNAFLQSNKHSKNYHSQLEEFLQTGTSNGRLLQLQIMVLPPSTFFKIHAHPNIEFEVTLQGCLEEFRFLFHVPKEELALSSSSSSSSLRGPNITKNHVFQHETVKAGQCMINEIGSVHQSYTGQQQSCTILVLWSGCHANTRPEQVDQDVDPQLKPTAGW
jgi:hypothetical protein